jgi:sugar/nucleoside kinase (ribokinase family)
MGKVFDIIVMGYIFNEHIKFLDKTVGPFLGATVSYSAVCLGRLGTKTGIVSNLGKDTPPELIRPFYEANVDTQGFNIREHTSTTKNLLVYDDNGNKRIEYLTRAPEIICNDIPEIYFNTKLFYLCPVDYEISPETIKEIKKKGNYIIAADLGGFGGAHSSIESVKKYANIKEEVFKNYMESLNIVKASMEDCQHLLGPRVTTPQQAMEQLLLYKPEIVIITLGEEGSLIGTAEKAYKISSVKTNVVDCTGAGDTYMASFLSAYLNTGDIERAGVFASATASFLIEKTGGVNVERFPTRAQVLERMKTL